MSLLRHCRHLALVLGVGAALALSTTADAQARGLHEQTGPSPVMSAAPSTSATTSPTKPRKLDGTGTWVRDGSSWRWRLTTSSYARNLWGTHAGVLYHFDSNGRMTTGWLAEADHWYFFHSTGACASGWISDRGDWYFLVPTSRVMATGELSLPNGAYRLDANGRMLTGWFHRTNGWIYFDASGRWVRGGWVSSGGAWYYIDPSTGIMQTGWAALNGYWYHLDASGAMRTGWLTDRGTWYYLDPASGAMRTGWLTDRGTWYYLDPASGAMATSDRMIDGAFHAFAATGQWLGSGFTANYIISDATMFDSSTMTAAQIQTFLDSKNPSCVPGSDATPCLKNYTLTTPSMTSEYCDPYRGAPGESAATVIYKSAQACGINPRVLIVMLQKEQGLVTGSGASLNARDGISRYDKAMGFKCPDFASCDPAYKGFSNQVYYAASRLIEYGERPGSFSFAKGRTSAIPYNPNRSCSSSQVTIANRATAALYNYTPFQPNAAALANMYGSGDSCSAYGNRNFWRYYTDWFSDPRH